MNKRVDGFQIGVDAAEGGQHQHVQRILGVDQLIVDEAGQQQDVAIHQILDGLEAVGVVVVDKQEIAPVHRIGGAVDLVDAFAGVYVGDFDKFVGVDGLGPYGIPFPQNNAVVIQRVKRQAVIHGVGLHPRFSFRSVLYIPSIP